MDRIVEDRNMAEQSASECSELFCLSGEIQSTFNVEDYLNITKKGSLKWEGSFESLKSFLDSFLNTETKWSTPRGGCKQCNAENDTEIRWYSNTKSLCISGPASENLKLKLTNFVHKNHEEALSGNDEENESLNNQTPNIELNTTNTTEDDYSDVSLKRIAENIKLLEDRMSTKIHMLSNEIDKLKSNNACNTDLSQEYMQNLINENKSLKSENDGLKERCENLVFAMAALKANVNDLEEEKKSLLMVIKVLQTDDDQHKPANKDDGWQKVKRRAKEKHSKTFSGRKKEMVINNKFEILSDSDLDDKPPETPLSERQKKKNNSQSQTNKVNEQEQSNRKPPYSKQKTKVPSTIIIGDSMIKHLDGRRLQRSSKTPRRVSTQTYRGSTTEDMKHHIRPSLARKPDEIVLHIGTNDLPKKNTQEISNGIIDIVNIVHSECPETKIVLSEIMPRADCSSYHAKIGKINHELQIYCEEHNIDLIQHGNVQAKHLNSYGVHLNRAGTSIFAKNLVNYFNKGSSN